MRRWLLVPISASPWIMLADRSPSGSQSASRAQICSPTPTPPISPSTPTSSPHSFPSACPSASKAETQVGLLAPQHSDQYSELGKNYHHNFQNHNYEGEPNIIEGGRHHEESENRQTTNIYYFATITQQPRGVRTADPLLLLLAQQLDQLPEVLEEKLIEAGKQLIEGNGRQVAEVNEVDCERDLRRKSDIPKHQVEVAQEQLNGIGGAEGGGEVRHVCHELKEPVVNVMRDQNDYFHELLMIMKNAEGQHQTR